MLSLLVSVCKCIVYGYCIWVPHYLKENNIINPNNLLLCNFYCGLYLYSKDDRQQVTMVIIKWSSFLVTSSE